MAAFRRPLFSILETIFPTIMLATKGGVRPGAITFDEVLSFLVLSVQAEANLRASVLPEISCSDASPTGGGSAVAKRFKSQSLIIPKKVKPSGQCVWCGRALTNDEGRVSYPCPRSCGEMGCSARCAQSHCYSEKCLRKSFSVVKFGERFSGPNFPLTKAVALEGCAVQKPMDILIKDNSWDFFTPRGKRRWKRKKRILR